MPASTVSAEPSAPDVLGSPTTVSVLTASIGSRHGYVVEGDSVRLQADLVVFDLTAAAARDWALQLWACADVFAGGTISGCKVAEIWLGSLEDFAASPSTLHATAAFHPPAGGGEFSMVLTLVAGTNGRFSEIHGYANYQRRENFLVPRINGRVAYRIDGRRVIVDVEAIENSRDPTNVSGTLSLELWALSAPYSGGHFSGAPLAGTVLGTLAGQHAWHPEPLDLAFTPPPEGTWHFTLMLREWAGSGYVTRDYSRFAQPVFYKAPPPEDDAPPREPATIAAEPATMATSFSAPAPDTTTPSVTRRKKAAKRATPTALSLNTATAAEFATISGLPKAVAARLVAERPFASLDDLKRVKGVGPRLLEKLKSVLQI
jgi:predicted flap endonuclease-1-like 5' DNA nuclease